MNCCGVPDVTSLSRENQDQRTLSQELLKKLMKTTKEKKINSQKGRKNKKLIAESIFIVVAVAFEFVDCAAGSAGWHIRRPL